MSQPESRKWWALGALSLSVLALGLDATVLSVALPTLARDLRASTTDLQWFVSAYALVLAAAVLPGGLLGDRYGRKRILLAGLVTFGVGSLACAFAPSPGAFIAARVLLGIGAAVVIPLSLSALTVLFNDAERPRAVGIWAAGNFVALPLGPILGGWVLTHYWWGWVFLLNLPVVAIGVVAVSVLLPESRSSERHSIDVVGVLTSSGGLTALTFGFIQAGQNGWGNAAAIAGMSGGLLMLVAFGLWERRLGRRPGGGALVDLALFRAPSFAWGTIIAALAVFAMFGILFTMPMFFQAVTGTDAMGSGVRLLPLIGGLVIGAGGLSRLAVPAGPKLTVAAGLAVLAAALGFGAATSASSSTLFVALWTGAGGVGMGLALATASAGALGELSEERAGVGAAVMQAVQKVGAPLAAAILGGVLNSTYRGGLQLTALPAPVADTVRGSVFAGVAVAQRLHSPALLASVRDAFASGIDNMLWVSFGIAALGVVLALAFLPGRRVVAGEAENLSAAVA